MPSMFEKYGMERAAASEASDEGKEWNDLSDSEKEKYYARVRQRKQTGGSREDNGGIPATDMYRRMGR